MSPARASADCSCTVAFCAFQPKRPGPTLDATLPRAQASRAFQRNLEREIGLPTLLKDERLSTAAVERSLIEQDTSRRRRAEVIDAHAAAYILQGVLDTK